jgi:chitodextrinase
MFPKWAEGTEYKEGQKIQYNGTLYRVLQSHAALTTWNPEATASLYAKVLIPDENIVPEWEQPNSTNAYSIGDKVKYNGSIYESLINNNVWDPISYPQGWKLITE